MDGRRSSLEVPASTLRSSSRGWLGRSWAHASQGGREVGKSWNWSFVVQNWRVVRAVVVVRVTSRVVVPLVSELAHRRESGDL